MASSFGSIRGGLAPRRGRGRGRGRGGTSLFFAKSRETYQPDLQKHPLGDVVEEFRSSELSLTSPRLAEMSGCQYVASYNWLKDEVPTIVVPGKPPQWTPLRAPRRLKEDSGQYFRDPNAAKYPNYPMAPVVRAILETKPEYDGASVDVFACGSTLGNLLRFARGVDRSFRFNVEVVGDTVFFIRKENDPKEVIKDVRGFGHTFPEAYTTWEHSVRSSETHQRIIRYEFGGLNCLVRFESDGYIRDPETIDGTAPVATAVNPGDLLEELRGAAISQPAKTVIGNPDTFEVKYGGSTVPQKSIFDLKTRSGKYKKEIDMTDIYPALWIKQISKFIVAYHDGHGLFEDVRVQEVNDNVQAWAKENRDGIRRFATLLKEIVDLAKTNADELLEVYCPGMNRLEVRKQYGHGLHALPADLVDRWERSNSGIDAEDNASDESDHVNGGISFDDRYNVDTASDDSSSELDYTACSADDCGYCGKCTY